MLSCSLLAPSHLYVDKEFLKVKKNLRKIGFKEIEDFTSKDYFFDRWAGSSNERLENLYSSWNSSSEVIMCFKGGSGVSHFLPLIKKNKLRKKKLFVGYSDITLLLNFLHKKLGIITLHGPNGLSELDGKTLFALKDALQMKNYGLEFKEFANVKHNLLKGKTIGGNLERLMETLFYIKLDFRGKIVFLEEVGHTKYKIFNLLISLKNYPSFKPRAIVFGDLGLGIKNNKIMKEMIKYLFPNTPLIMDLPFGHCIPKITIPIGANCKIDFREKKIRFSFPRKHKKYAVKFD